MLKTYRIAVLTILGVPLTLLGFLVWALLGFPSSETLKAL